MTKNDFLNFLSLKEKINMFFFFQLYFTFHCTIITTPIFGVMIIEFANTKAKIPTKNHNLPSLKSKDLKKPLIIIQEAIAEKCEA